MLLFPPGIQIKGKRLDEFSLHIIQSSLRLHKPKLDHTSPYPKMRDALLTRDSLTSNLITLADVTIVFNLLVLARDDLLCVSCGKHKTISTPIGLLFHEVNRICDFLILIHNHLSNLHFTWIITSHSLQSEKHIVLVVMDAFMKDVIG